MTLTGKADQHMYTTVTTSVAHTIYYSLVWWLEGLLSLGKSTTVSTMQTEKPAGHIPTPCSP